MIKVLIATGGTGGHIFPAVVIGRYLSENGANVVFTGRKNGIEREIIEKEGMRIKSINARKFKGMNFINKMKSIIQLFFLIFSCFKIFREEKPDFVIGTGGYVAAPVVLAAFIARIKCGICEQNALMGFGNRCLAFFVKHIFLSFENTLKVPFRYKSKVTGNFIRKGFENRGDSEKGILVFGGSQGAKRINEVFCGSLEKISNINGVKIFHITGEKDFERVKEIYKKFNGKIEYEIYPFVHNMEEIFKNVSLIVCRAGATSIAEIYYSGKRAILIPYPYAADNHQWFNAVEFCKTGRGVVLKESFLNEEKLVKWINFFINNKKRFEYSGNILGDYREGLKYIYELARETQPVTEVEC
jgi:UDP-N-acetylglucosamine--N-acetylmuramyl-(pentapeptide) pyrophosphoryl-undecaprenol N-acetylglucosamine transferase